MQSCAITTPGNSGYRAFVTWNLFYQSCLFSLLLDAKKEPLKEVKTEKETTQATSTQQSTSKSTSQSKSTSKSTTTASKSTTTTSKSTSGSASTSKSKSNSISTQTTTKTNSTLNKEKVATNQKDRFDLDIAINNYGQNLNLKVNQTKFRNVPKNSFKNILFWNEALPLKLFGLIFVGELIYVI